jgi:hypothetical protein
MHKLKRYQENTLEALQRFLERSRLTTIHEAFREAVAERAVRVPARAHRGR